MSDRETGVSLPSAGPVRHRSQWGNGPTIRSVSAALILAAVALASIVFLPPIVAGGALLLVSGLYVFRRVVFNWTTLLFLLAAVIMFVPIRRYAVPIPLPFALEPYRLLIALMLVGMIVALIVSPEFRWRPVAFGWPIAIFLATQAISIVANGPSLVEQGLDGGAAGNLIQITFLISVFYLVRQLLTSERIVELLLVFLTWAAVVVGFFALVERFTRVNVFLLLGNFLPLTLLRDESESLRAGGARAYASSQHPIALSVALCMLIPIALYLAKHAGWPKNPINRRVVYALAIVVMLCGILATVSRTGFVVMGVMFLVTLILIPRLGFLLAAFAFPVGILGAALAPKLFESTVLSFFDFQSLIESQYASPGYRGQGRLADLDPAFAEVREAPVFGTGLGSRIVVGDDANAFILDNQVLGTLMETGVIGVIGLAIFMLVPSIRLYVFAFQTKAGQRYAALAFAVAVSITGYAVAMFFYDAFAFMQTFLILMLLLAVGAWLLTEIGLTGRAGSAAAPRREAEPQPSRETASEAMAAPESGAIAPAGGRS